MAGIINTGKVLNNAWIQGTAETSVSGPIAIDPSLEKQYDYALTSDPILLQERKDTQERLYKIFQESPYFKKYGGFAKDDNIPSPKKIEKGDIVNVFYYMKEKLDEQKKLTISEEIIAINEFFEFNYDTIVNEVLSIPLKSKLYEELYEEHQSKMTDTQEKLF